MAFGTDNSYGIPPPGQLKPGTQIYIKTTWDSFAKKGDVIIVVEHLLLNNRPGLLYCLAPRLQGMKSFNDNYFGSHFVLVEPGQTYAEISGIGDEVRK